MAEAQVQMAANQAQVAKIKKMNQIMMGNMKQLFPNNFWFF